MCRLSLAAAGAQGAMGRREGWAAWREGRGEGLIWLPMGCNQLVVVHQDREASGRQRSRGGWGSPPPRSGPSSPPSSATF